MRPLQTDLVRIELQRFELEIIEKRRYELHRSADQAVRRLMLHAQVVQERRQIGSIGPKVSVVIYVRSLFDRRTGARVVEMVDSPGSEASTNVAGVAHGFRDCANPSFFPGACELL